MRSFHTSAPAYQQKWPLVEGRGGLCVLEGVHINRQCEGTVFSHDLFFLANGKEKCANMINGHDYLFRKCGFLAQQLLFYDLNPGREVSSCRQSHAQTCGDDRRIPDEVFTSTRLQTAARLGTDGKGEPLHQQFRCNAVHTSKNNILYFYSALTQ